MQASTVYTDDKQLWSSFLKGNRESYAYIYKCYFPALYDYGMRICNNAELVKDCIQDLFVKLWVNREHLNPTNAIQPYLYTALRSAVLNKLDHEHRLSNREDRAGRINSFDVHYTIEDALISMDEQQARNKMIFNALNNLTPNQKEGIFLRFYVGLEYPEIAGIMHITVKSTYKLIGRGIAEMRKYFKEVAVFVSLLLLFFFSR